MNITCYHNAKCSSTQCNVAQCNGTATAMLTAAMLCMPSAHMWPIKHYLQGIENSFTNGNQAYLECMRRSLSQPNFLLPSPQSCSTSQLNEYSDEPTYSITHTPLYRSKICSVNSSDDK
eukprot:14551-Heterococcus_DN1.PRE.5